MTYTGRMRQVNALRQRVKIELFISLDDGKPLCAKQ